MGKTTLDRWRALFDLAGIPDDDFRDRLAEALATAANELHKPHGLPIHFVLVDFENYDPRERDLPLLICADFGGGDAKYQLRKALWHAVFLPIYMDLRLRFPIDLMTKDEWEDLDQEMPDVAFVFPARP